MTPRHTGVCVKTGEDPRSFLLEGGEIRWTGQGLAGVLRGGHLAVNGDLSTMKGLERTGRARRNGNGFWTSPTCPHCGGVVTPEFSCCATPYA